MFWPWIERNPFIIRNFRHSWIKQYNKCSASLIFQIYEVHPSGKLSLPYCSIVSSPSIWICNCRKRPETPWVLSRSKFTTNGISCRPEKRYQWWQKLFALILLITPKKKRNALEESRFIVTRSVQIHSIDVPDFLCTLYDPPAPSWPPSSSAALIHTACWGSCALCLSQLVRRWLKKYQPNNA